jgi:hypothetical protein
MIFVPAEAATMNAMMAMMIAMEMIERILLDDFRMNAIARIVAGMNYCVLKRQVKNGFKGGVWGATKTFFLD